MNAPPLLVSYPTLKKYFDSLPRGYVETYGDELSVLHCRGLPPVCTELDLSVLFGYSRKFIFSMERNSKRYYRSFNLKNGNKIRTINAPKVALKVIQKWLGFHISRAFSPKNCVYGFVPGRHYSDAAKVHCNSQWVFSYDLRDFFPSITFFMVLDAFLRLGYSDRASELLANLCCYQGVLAQGSPASPVISNLVFDQFDEQLQQLADKYSAKYTRYADDIVFSGQDDSCDQLRLDVADFIKLSPFELADNKTYVSDARTGAPLFVHGLRVNGDVPKLRKSYRNNIRAYKHVLNKNASDDFEGASRIKGHVKFYESIISIT